MSSTYRENYANNCIDGRTSNGQNCGRGHSCCHTNKNGWLTIDYGKPVAINQIKVYNRDGDSEAERYAPLHHMPPMRQLGYGCCPVPAVHRSLAVLPVSPRMVWCASVESTTQPCVVLKRLRCWLQL